MTKREILFHKTMSADKRGDTSAYLIKNVADTGTRGLYPSRDFVVKLPDVPTLIPDGEITYISGQPFAFPASANPRVVVRVGDNLLYSPYRFYRVGSDTEVNTSGTYGMVALTEVWGDEITPYFVDTYNGGTSSVDRVLTFNDYDAGVSVRGDFPSSANVSIGKYDGNRIWWVGQKIWKQLLDEDPELAMAESGIDYPDFIDFWRDYLVIADNIHNFGTVIYFFDKTSSTFFSKRLTMLNSNLLGFGNIDGQLTLVTAVPNPGGNERDIPSKIVVSAFNGEEFVEINEIVGGQSLPDKPNTPRAGTSCRVFNNYMLLGVDENDNTTLSPDLARNYIYKVYKDGSLQVLTLPPDSSAKIIYSNKDYVVYSDGEQVIRHNGGDPNVFPEFSDFTETQYITNFLTNPYNHHKLSAFNVAFEKLFVTQTDPDLAELDVYYRTSSLEGWTLLGNVTAEKVIANVNLRADAESQTPLLFSQRYQFTKMPDGTSLPEFNEIQFKFHSQHGFSVIGAWFEYEYITRNTVR